ncbi:MAG TPA: translation initiation factor IF-3 [Candidatus Paceibacterota bacterium]
MQKQFNKRVRLNNQIKEPQVQVIDADGKQLGILPTHEALKLAQERELDLVEVGAGAVPPIAKIMDYGKYMYQKEKRERDNRQPKSAAHEIKTIQIGFTTGAHDLELRASQTDKFLKKGHRVRIEITMRGRQKGMSDLAKTKLDNFIKIIPPSFTLEETPKRSPRGFSVLIKPENKK